MTRTLSLLSSLQLGILAGLLSGAGIAEAQLVQIGPGYVKAPFVRVYRTPYGTSVRAPFTQVEGGTPVYGRRFQQQPDQRFYLEPEGVVPPANDLGGGDPDPQDLSFDNAADTEASLLERQRRLVGKSARRLDHDLRSFPRASHWLEVLQLPPEFLDAKPMAGSNQAAQPDQEAVKIALQNFDVVAGHARYRRIAQLQSFRTTHRLLRQYVSLLSLPREEPLPSLPENEDPLLLKPAAIDQPAEELSLPLPEVAR